MGKTNKLSLGFKLAWSSRTASQAVLTVLLNTYVSLYATNYMGIPVTTASLVFLISKIFDGFTDLFAGYLIDHTHTRWGKARPYELAMIGYWGATVALYCAPDMSVRAATIYLFIMYVLINAVFYTLVQCSDPVYLANAIPDRNLIVSNSSFTGIVTMIFTLITTAVLPQLVATIGVTKAGWRTLSISIAIPMLLISFLRFIFIKEINTNPSDVQNQSSLGIKEEAKLLFKNKYIMLFALIMLVANIGSNFGTNINTYYYMYIIGDVGAGSVGALSVVSLIIAIAITPVLSKKIGFMTTIRGTVLIGAIGFLIRLIDVHNMVLLAVSLLLSSICFTVTYMFINVFIAECMDYGEWKNGIRAEGTIACAQSVMCKIGTAFGLGISGLMIGAAGFDGTLAVQTEAASNMIIICTTIAPAIIGIIMYVMLRFYDLDKLMPQIKKDLTERKNAV